MSPTKIYKLPTHSLQLLVFSNCGLSFQAATAFFLNYFNLELICFPSKQYTYTENMLCFSMNFRNKKSCRKITLSCDISSTVKITNPIYLTALLYRLMKNYFKECNKIEKLYEIFIKRFD